MILLELIGFLIFFFLISFPVWIHGNWKTLFDKELKRYLKEERKRKSYKIDSKRYTKICTQHQPYKINERYYIICNFPCDGNCMFQIN